MGLFSVIWVLGEVLEALDEQIYVLRDRKLYSDEMGLLVNVSRGEAVFA